jgi:hypothetical protein
MLLQIRNKVSFLPLPKEAAIGQIIPSDGTRIAQATVAKGSRMRAACWWPIDRAGGSDSERVSP